MFLLKTAHDLTITIDEISMIQKCLVFAECAKLP